jgi:hypothetical protein
VGLSRGVVVLSRIAAKMSFYPGKKRLNSFGVSKKALPLPGK